MTKLQPVLIASMAALFLVNCGERHNPSPEDFFSADGNVSPLENSENGGTADVLPPSTPAGFVQIDENVSEAENIRCEVSIDGALAYRWYVNDDIIVGQSEGLLPKEQFSAFDEVYCEVFASNENGESESISSNTVVVTPAVSLKLADDISLNGQCSATQRVETSYVTDQAYESSELTLEGINAQSETVNEFGWTADFDSFSIASVSEFHATWLIQSTGDYTNTINTAFEVVVAQVELPSLPVNAKNNLYTGMYQEGMQIPHINVCHAGIRAGIAASEDATCLLDELGRVYCTGGNDLGQLGDDGIVGSMGTLNQVDPLKIDGTRLRNEPFRFREVTIVTAHLWKQERFYAGAKEPVVA